VEHSISAVARMAGISSRTLRHYNEIGLLPPARVSANGYRWYGRHQLLRLQRVLLLRELGVALPRIAEILDGEADELAALRRHREQLAAEHDRLTRVIATVDRTIAGLTGERILSDKEFFTGLAQRRDRLRDDLVGQYGPGVHEHFAAAEAATAGWDRADYGSAAAEGHRLLSRMSGARARGVAPGDDEALVLVEEHHRAVTAIWPADAAAYHALGDLLVDDPTQRAMIAEVDPELPRWLATAVKAYAVDRLGHRT
jgi:DNA-binding transcriptional MerR regulator